jgi:DNA-3-methyladenine glycosylase II
VSQPAYWANASVELAARDPVMAGFVVEYAGMGLVQKGDPFATLCRAIVSQQISVKAADAIWARVDAAVGGIAPQGLAAADFDTLRNVGLSRAKITYLQDLSLRALDKRFDPTRWLELDDAAVMAELTAVKGIGRWTAEMYLIFSLQRPDILPVDDIGLQKAIAQHYLNGERPTAKAMHALADKYWRPWRTVATWYLWRSLDPVAVAY